MPQLNTFAITTFAVGASASLVAWQALKRIQYVGPDEQVSLPQTTPHGGIVCLRPRISLPQTALLCTTGVLQVLLKRLTDKVVVNGPTVFFPSPLTTLSYKKRKGISLTALQCGCHLPSSMGACRACSEIGPGRLWRSQISHPAGELQTLIPCLRHSFLDS